MKRVSQRGAGSPQALYSVEGWKRLWLDVAGGNQHGAAEGILGVADEKRRVGARGMGMATGA